MNKVHPLFERVVLYPSTGEIREWRDAGKPVCVEEEPTTEVGRVLSRHGCYKDQELDIKDARIRELEQEGQNAHALYREADAKVKELQAKLSEKTSEATRYSEQLAEAEKDVKRWRET
jgi:peptidoglycan hydrolase CwlO-like protein